MKDQKYKDVKTKLQNYSFCCNFVAWFWHLNVFDLSFFMKEFVIIRSKAFLIFKKFVKIVMAYAIYKPIYASLPV